MKWHHGSVIVLATLILTGCATTQETTPRQDYTWAMWDRCKAQLTTRMQVNSVDTDGRYWSNTADSGVVATEWPKITGCMQEQFKAHPFLDWLKAQKLGTLQPSVAVGSTVAVASAPSGQVTAPVWQVGDEWQYAYKSPTDSGTYVWSVNRVEMLDGVQHYVVKTGTREIFYRVSDLASSLERVDGVVVSRETPSRLNFSFPLTVGKSWEQSHRQERPVDRQTTDHTSIWTIEAEETVTVIAGTFRTMKVTRRNKNTGALINEMWVAPDVKQFVKIREILSNGERERELVSFKLK
jgi:hypothetical protein